MNFIELKFRIQILQILVAGSIFSSPNYNFPLNRPYTLKNSSPFVLEEEYHRLIESNQKRSFIFPRSCHSPVDSSKICYENSKIHFGNEERSDLDIKLNSGLEYRYLNENVESLDLGISTYGYQGLLSFYLDAGMFVELHENSNHTSYDREFINKQDEEASGTIAYSSFARYRSNFSLNTDFGKITAARDALHWGPGLYTNLVFHQNAIPFNYLSYSSGIGPLRFITVYGKLAISPNNNFFPSFTDERNLYAHRYEITFSKNLLVGISEQLILFENDDPFAFIPVVPLYITKGTQVERNNNGNIAFDISYKVMKSWHFYSEFLIDDLQAPTSLFDDFWGNKWGIMAGLHKIMKIKQGNLGLVLEASRIEPWVFTHYRADEAQSAHLGYPLGNQNGPNSQNLINKLYFRHNNGFYFSVLTNLIWKGFDNGSKLNDEISPREQKLPKKFIAGISEPEVIIQPYLGYYQNTFGFELSAAFGADFKPVMRFTYSY